MTRQHQPRFQAAWCCGVGLSPHVPVGENVPEDSVDGFLGIGMGVPGVSLALKRVRDEVSQLDPGARMRADQVRGVDDRLQRTVPNGGQAVPIIWRPD